ncbi:glycosyltransferase [Salipiger aestuarii]|uniref:glycosyltransferase n=1 Tax=Salipiger aestuarii TaxID=568098 RepID=UPI00025B8B33|nr:glycosyltransferase [Salipiger aestuarii]EIE48633.1 succinoglycan biosynthesis protein ExoM [Citreicella sp. 357]KAA8606556.1 glycosyltransferase [Salipiger aestuarii]KAA8610055.1 glycosyltransferase [Salipiger aestuarii]
MNAPFRKIDALLCTFRRDDVRETLLSLDAQQVPAGVDLRVVVSDNDGTASARRIVTDTAARMRVPVLYLHAPAFNISIARNAGLDAASARGADWVAFLDDDERADPDWLAQLIVRAGATGADAVFGPSLAQYGCGAPDWMRAQDVHSNRPVRRGTVVQTGHTCNAFLRWNGAAWRTQRFDIARGQAGGEDTEFFFRLFRAGARFEIAEDAIVRERVAPGRMTFGWILRRKFRSGQSYAAGAHGWKSRAARAGLAVGKGLVCASAAMLFSPSRARRNRWLLRGALHVGVVAGCLNLRQPRIYGLNSGP